MIFNKNEIPYWMSSKLKFPMNIFITSKTQIWLAYLIRRNPFLHKIGKCLFEVSELNIGHRSKVGAIKHLKEQLKHLSSYKHFDNGSFIQSLSAYMK